MSQSKDETGISAPRATRYSAGKALRDQTSRESHADCPPGSERDPVAILAESDPQRLPNLLPIRYQRMTQSSFTFLRGAAAVMAHDLSELPKIGIPVQACGDCHLMNFGAFNTPEGRMLFDINDFDETLPGVDFTVDLKRLVASVAVAARDAGVSDKRAKALARNVARAYREFMRELAEETPLEVWYARMDIEREVRLIDDPKLRNDLLSLLIKSKKDLAADDNFPHLASTKDGVAQIQDHPPLIYHFTDEMRDQKIHAHSAFAEYQQTLLPDRRALVERYRLADIAMKVVGVGSVGTFCAIGLFMTADQEPLFLQVKQALHSVLEKIVAPPQDLAAQGGRRVVEGQRALQAASDLFLGWTEDKASQRQFYVRQLKNRRLGSVGEVIESRSLDAYANLCGRTLARAHARTGDPALIAGYMGKCEILDEALASFAMSYAALTDRDHARLVQSIDKKTGLPAAPTHTLT
ncbi:MAG: DUF2252 domain-containing protein [Methylocella sp.]